MITIARRTTFPLLFAIVAAISLRSGLAQENLLVSGALADSSIAAPLLHWSGRSYTIGISGWTIEGQWQRQIDARRALLVSADATPVHAHNSNRMFIDGRRIRSLEYDDASYRMKAGVRLIQNEHSHVDASLIGLYENIGGIADRQLADFWREPYLGAQVAHTLSFIASSNPLIASFDGAETSVRVESFTGKKNWSRVRVSESAARTFGAFHLRESITAVTGRSLNVVNRFLIGGSWDGLGGDALYGSRYGEYRVTRAAIASGGADCLLSRHWRIGVRGSYMRSDAANTYGHALNASTTLGTVGLNFGVGFPQRHEGSSRAIVYAAIVAPLYKR